MRLGIVFNEKLATGGGYQQALNAALIARELPDHLVHIEYFTTVKENVNVLKSYGIKVRLINLSFLSKATSYLRMRITNPLMIKIIKKIIKHSPFERYLINHQIDLVYFLSPTSWANSLEELNYITTVWDLSHRDDPEFPEVRFNREFEARDSNYFSILPRAVAIFVDSGLGKENLTRRYGIDGNRVHVIPFSPAVGISSASEQGANSANIRQQFDLDCPYIFYPAQFWAHKNHIYLLQGLQVLQEKYDLRIGVIFCGGDKGNLAYIKKYTEGLGLIDRVRFAGFVSNQTMLNLYQQSLALVMPSHFGPTNLPPLEAFALGVPVLYSDKAGLRDQVDNAALLIDLKNPDSMAIHLKSLIEDDQLRNRLINAGFDRLKQLDTIDRLNILKNIIEDFRWKRQCWE